MNIYADSQWTTYHLFTQQILQMRHSNRFTQLNTLIFKLYRVEILKTIKYYLKFRLNNKRPVELDIKLVSQMWDNHLKLFRFSMNIKHFSMMWASEDVRLSQRSCGGLMTSEVVLHGSS